MSPMLRRSVKEQHPFDDDNITKLADWIRDASAQVEAKSPSDSSCIQLPEFIASMVHSLFSDLSKFSEAIAEEIERNFGIEDTARLIRHGNRDGAKITLKRHTSETSGRFKPFEYELALKRTKSEGTVIPVSEETPLYLDAPTERMQHVLLGVLDALNTLGSGDDDRGKPRSCRIFHKKHFQFSSFRCCQPAEQCRPLSSLPTAPA